MENRYHKNKSNDKRIETRGKGRGTGVGKHPMDRNFNADERTGDRHEYRERRVREDRNTRAERDTEADEGLVIGRNAVRELLRTDRTVDKLLVRRGDREGSIVVLVAEAIE